MTKLFASFPRRWCVAATALLFPVLASAQKSSAPAQALLRDDAAAEPSPLTAALRHARPLVLDVAAARAVLAAAPPEGQASAALVLALPLPDGHTGRFAVTQTTVMAPALAARYPDIRTYAGWGLDDRTATVRLDLTPAGFHAQILSARTGTIYIDPARRGDVRHYLSFFKRDMRPTAGQPCGFKPGKADQAAAARRQAAQPVPAASGGGAAEAVAGGALRTYRLAVSATGEYVAFHGGTVALGQAAIVTSVNRVVGVYEKELAVRMVLVPNNDVLVYPNAATDGFSNNDGGAMLGENQQRVDSLIGSANYDIGHIFSTNGGGVAGYAVVCDPGRKAQGVTGTDAPVGDAFDIDYVAHEMGHQFSGSHPFNGTDGSCGGNRSADAAWEPGSGSTIMAYAGICGADDLQPHSDPHFHVGNFEEMRGFILTTPCPTLTSTGNTPPVVTPPASGKTLPKSTPFKLTATATDAEGDSLTYNWEELDLGPAGSPLAPQVANRTPPLFRSFVPQTTATRYFPRLSELVNNTTMIGERLPGVARGLVFKCTVRDEHSGPAGVIGGVTSSDSLTLRVTSAAGPFAVTAPNTALTWAGGSTQTVTWDVAGTTANGVDCASVNVRLSTDGGFTYPTVLATAVPNSGTASVTVPSVTTTTARVMVEAADNYFFDISNANFTINSAAACPAPTAVVVQSVTTTTAQVTFQSSAPAASVSVTTTPATTTITGAASPLTLTGLAPGTTYTVNVVSACGTSSQSTTTAATFTTAPLPGCSAPSEVVALNVTSTSATVYFVGAGPGATYTLTTVPATTTQTVSTSPVVLTGLVPNTLYTISLLSSCGAIGTSAATTLSFATPPPPPANDQCAAALPLTCGARVTGSTVGATTTGDPAQSCGGTGVDQGGVFYALTGNGGTITVSTCDAATSFDTKLFVYQGPCGGPYTCVGGNDDTNTGGCRLPSTVSFASVSGATYLVLVSGYGTDTGTFGLLATCGPAATPAELVAPRFEVWPNPVGTNATLRLTLAAPASAATATLRNVLGQRVSQQTFRGAGADLPTVGLAAGTYLLTVQTDGQAPMVRRVVVE